MLKDPLKMARNGNMVFCRHLILYFAGKDCEKCDKLGFRVSLWLTRAPNFLIITESKCLFPR